MNCVRITGSLLLLSSVAVGQTPQDGSVGAVGVLTGATAEAGEPVSSGWKEGDVRWVHRAEAALAALPVRYENGTIEVATAAEKEEILEWAQKRFNRRTNELREALEDATADGELDADDIDLAFDAAIDDSDPDDNPVGPEEMEVLRHARDGELYGKTDTVTITDEAIEVLEDLVFNANRYDHSDMKLIPGYTYGDSEMPGAVKRFMIEARLRGAESYDPDLGDDWTDYPSSTEAEGTFAFEYTEITPASLVADRDDTEDHLRVTGVDRLTDLEVTSSTPWGDYTHTFDEFHITRFKFVQGGSGQIGANNSHLAGYHNQRHNPFYTEGDYFEEGDGILDFADVYEAAEVPAEHTAELVLAARGPEGNKWSNNTAITDDFAFHCLPALRNHDSTGGLVLTNPALARDHKLMWHGHMTVRLDSNDVPTLTSIGTSGRVGKNVSRGKAELINAAGLFEAWCEGSDGAAAVSPGLRLRSDHREQPIVGEFVIRENPANPKNRILKELRDLRD